MRDIHKELDHLEITNKRLRDFVLLFCAVCTLWAGVSFYKGNPHWPWFVGAALVFLTTGLLFPATLRQAYRLWMAFAFTLGWFMTRFILLVAYAVIMTPMGWLMRLSGKDLLDERIEKDALSYWKKHDPVSDHERYKKQF